MAVTNQILNPSFENDVANWTIASPTTTFTRLASSAQDGLAAGKCASVGATTTVLWSNEVATTPGQIWSVGSYAKWLTGATPRQCWLVMQFLDAGHANLGNFVGTGTPTTSAWLQITQLNKTAPASTAFVRVELWCVSTANGEEVLYDAIQLENSATLPAFNPSSNAMPDVKVEIAFTTTPDDPSPNWVDVSSYVDADQGISISRGRSDELSDVQPSRLQLTLDNRDGRFTPGNASGAYYPNVKKGRRIRVRAMWPLGGSYADRFTGYVDEWPVQWPDSTSAFSTVEIAATSRQARVSRGAELRSVIEHELLADDPKMYYPMGEPGNTSTTGNASVYPQDPLVKSQIGSGGTLVFGAGDGPLTDAVKAPVFTRASVGNGKYLVANIETPLTTGFTQQSMAGELWINTTASGPLMQLLNPGGFAGPGDAWTLNVTAGNLTFKYTEAGTTLTTTRGAVNDGLTHHVVWRMTGDGGAPAAYRLTLFIDGAQSGATATLGTSHNDGGSTVFFPVFGQLFIGGDLTTFTPDAGMGTFAHAAVYASVAEISNARWAQHALAGSTGFSGDTSNARIARIARYAGYASGDVTTETGLSTSIAFVDTTGQAPSQLMADVTATEGGVLFDGRDGKLNFQARSHRYNASSALTLDATAGDVEADLEPKLDDQGLVNDISVSRTDGVAVRAVDTASITDYGTYRDQLDLLTTSDNEVTDAANWIVGHNSVPQVRVPSVSVDVLNLADPSKTTIFTLDIGSKVTLANLPSQAPAASMDFFIEGYTETIGLASYRMAFNLSPVLTSTVWQLDSSVYSVLGSTTIPGY